MHTVTELPQGYVQKDYVNPSADRALSRSLNFITFVLSAALLALGWLWRGFAALNSAFRAGLAHYALLVLVLLAALTAFSWLHQLTHGLLLRLCSGKAPLFARKGLRLFVGSDAYLCRRDSLLVLLLPAHFWTLAAGLACCFLTGQWFWIVYTALLANFAGAVEDVYFAVCALRAPKTALVQYRGFAAGIYTEEA